MYNRKKTKGDYAMGNICDRISDFIEHCQNSKNLNEKTIKAYHTDLEQYSGFSESELSKDRIKPYITHLNKTYKPKTVRRKIATLKAFVRFLFFEEMIETNPFEKIRIKTIEPLILPKTIPSNTISDILHSAYNGLKVTNTSYREMCAVRDVAVLEILFATGARVSEICSLKPENVNIEDGYIKIFGKGARERIVQIENEEVIASVARYYETFREYIEMSGFFFVNKLHKRLSEQSVRVIINRHTAFGDTEQHITPHMFRHTFATLLLEEDVDIRYIQEMLGHSSITTTQIYTHVSSAKQRMILATKHPRNKMKFGVD
jgi:integrase/recombinase XerD